MAGRFVRPDLIFCFGFVFEAVQTNTIADTTKAAWGWDQHYVGVAWSF